ncbi:arylacetamide deacetylase-like 4 [Nothoprocta perdicaria]|uniref:arylacetamide deacetylase-like 4 n=1 Tax=Nothoprocta perdicaria TaxID=30464 RepID=UPI000E1C1E23|nr:arylacetamide deacetylase-like 4 [Nothoprocta perdicaria]
MELLLAIFLVVLTVFVVGAFYCEHPKAEIPPGFIDRKKIYIFHYIMNFGFGLAKFLEKIGITSEVHVLRTAMDGIPPLKDNNLLIKDLSFDKIKVRIYQPKTPTTGRRRGVLYFHGGVGRFGSIRAYERTCRYFTKKSNSVFVSVGYRLAPEYPYPTQFEDCLAATVHFMKIAEDYGVDPARVIVCGDSSGGTIAAAVAQAMTNRKDLPKLRAQILIYPFLQAASFNLPSYEQNRGVPVLLKKRTLILGLKYLNKEESVLDAVLKGAHVPRDLDLKCKEWLNPDNIPEDFKSRDYQVKGVYQEKQYSEDLCRQAKPILDPIFSPLLAEDSVIAQLPETFLLSCEFDVLRDDVLLYKKRLEDHGIKVTWCHLEQGFHGIIFLANYGRLASFKTANKGLQMIADFLKSI